MNDDGDLPVYDPLLWIDVLRPIFRFLYKPVLFGALAGGMIHSILWISNIFEMGWDASYCLALSFGSGIAAGFVVSFFILLFIYIGELIIGDGSLYISRGFIVLGAVCGGLGGLSIYLIINYIGNIIGAGILA